MHRVACLLVAVACGGDDPAPEPVLVEVSAGDEDPLPAPPPETLTPDEARTAFVQQPQSDTGSRLPADSQIASPNAPPRAAGLGPALAHYASLHALSFTQTQQTSIQDATRGLTRAIEIGADAVQAIDQACDGVAAVAECTTIRADARDLLANRVRGITMPLPHDIHTQIQSLSSDLQAEIQSEIAARIQEMMDAKAAELFCLAADLYRQANTLRAQDQLRRYGPVQCN